MKFRINVTKRWHGTWVAHQKRCETKKTKVFLTSLWFALQSTISIPKLNKVNISLDNACTFDSTRDCSLFINAVTNSPKPKCLVALTFVVNSITRMTNTLFKHPQIKSHMHINFAEIIHQWKSSSWPFGRILMGSDALEEAKSSNPPWLYVLLTKVLLRTLVCTLLLAVWKIWIHVEFA